ncbi:MAG: glycosyltransferase family 4 protein [Planctomycetota bacterium]
MIVCDLLSTFLRFRLPIAVRLRDLGHKVTLITSDPDSTSQRFSELAGVGIDLEVIVMNRTGMNPFRDLQYAFSLRKAFRRLQPDRILAYQAKCATWTAIAARPIPDAKVAILFPGLGYLFSPSVGFKSDLLKFAVRKLCRFAYSTIDIAIFQNDEDRKTLAEHGIALEGVEIHRVNGSGVDLRVFPPSVPPNQPIRFSMATRLLSDKGIREFAEAARQLKSVYGAEVEFVVAGKFDRAPSAIQKQELQAWVDEGIIEYPGLVDDMQEFLLATSVFVLPSYYMEGTPRSILEALSVGRPVITTDHRGCRETVDDGVNGFLIPTKSVTELAKAMETYLKQPELLIQMGKMSRQLAESKYDVRIVASQMIQALAIRESTQESQTDLPAASAT